MINEEKIRILTVSFVIELLLSALSYWCVRIQTSPSRKRIKISRFDRSVIDYAIAESKLVIKNRSHRANFRSSNISIVLLRLRCQRVYTRAARRAARLPALFTSPNNPTMAERPGRSTIFIIYPTENYHVIYHVTNHIHYDT